MIRFFYTLIASIVIYTILIVTLFYNFDLTTYDTSNNYKKDQQIITLIKEIKNTKEINKQNSKTKEKKIVKKTKIKETKIVKKIKVEKEQTLKTVVQSKVNKKQVLNKEIKNVSKDTNIQQRKQKLVTSKTVNSKKLNLEKTKYYRKIKETINKNKQYPRIAKRVGKEGTVKIDFVLSSRGDLLSYKIIAGDDIFKRSVVEAIENSFPLEIPNGLFKKKLHFTLNVEYNLY